MKDATVPGFKLRQASREIFFFSKFGVTISFISLKSL